ncbi:GNAT family N-acetyltransferase [Jeongeupia naejangsanensis]|uniref:GNAT family N-acetyltransferase n=1 Tax=Jeongeupia naejangsanensis TaxID=613195 RepID=A0ABS2BNG8_9NEIS|nr:GNAT family N-acetyltransferase [Jeongeupia naejangsanensis]MBM3117166.1 GNAT family N-acetyltransferase [Jeongeupia naejangsanensis]
MDARVRRLGDDDVSSLVGAFIATFNAAPWHDEWQQGTAQAYLTGLRAHPAGYGWVIERDGVLLGAALGHVRRWWGGDELFVDEFFIHADCQRQGLGRQLLDALEDDLRTAGIGAVTLLTARSTPAEDFYLAGGYHGKPDLRFMAKAL